MVGWAGVLLLGLGLLPGLPILPFASVGAGFVGFALWSSTSLSGRPKIEHPEDSLGGGLIRGSSTPNERDGISTTVRSFTIQLDGAILAPNFFEKELFYRQRWAQFAQDAFASFGIKLPRLQVERDTSLDKGEYRVTMKGNELFRGKLDPSEVLVELGVENAELLGFIVSREEIHPCCGKTVFWAPAIHRTVNIAQAGDIRLLDFVEFLYLQVFDFYRQFPEEILGILDVHLMVRELDRKFPGTVEDSLHRNFIDAPRLTELAHDLIRERIDISDFPALVESVLAYCSNHRALLSMGGDFDVGHAVAHIRVQKRRSITNRILTDQRALRAITISPAFEKLFEEIPTESGPAPMSISPSSADLLIESLVELIEPIRRIGIQRVCVLCRPDLRGRVAKFLRSVSGHYQAISIDELDSGLLVEQLGVWQPKR
jgi:flagellar biosynthesis component FlhA